MENTTYTSSGTRVACFPYPDLTSEHIDGIISGHTVVFAEDLYLFLYTKKITRRNEFNFLMVKTILNTYLLCSFIKYCFCHAKIKFMSLCRCV